MLRTAAAAAVVALVLAGCSQPMSTTAPSTSAPAPAPSSSVPAPAPSSASPNTKASTAAESATAIAKRIEAKVSSITKVVTVTEDNDPNDRIGRPNGYTDAAVIYDKNVDCDDLGAGCGATIEIWPSETDAQARADYIQKALKDSPVLGTEYDTVRGSVLLRVSGELKPSIAKAYAAVL